MNVDNLITGTKICPNIHCQIFTEYTAGRNRGLHPDLSTDLCVFTLKSGYRNVSCSIDFFGLRHNSPLFCYFLEIISILKKNGPKYTQKVANF